MGTNKFLWTNRNLQKSSYKQLRQQEALDFINVVQNTESSFDFSLIAEEFVKIPEINIFSQKFPELSLPSKKIFEKIYAINDTKPEIGLKIITILACNIECASYTPKLEEVIFKKLEEWLMLDVLNRRTRIEWGVFCWKNWPVRFSNFDKNIFVKPLVKLFIAESEFDADYILTVYDDLFETRSNYSYIFNQFSEDPENFLLFAKNLKEVRPRLLIDGLLRFIRDGKNGYGGYNADIEKLKSSCNELFEMLKGSDSLIEERREEILRELILYSYPDLPWYYDLHSSLWEREKNKACLDRMSSRNYFVITVNAAEEFENLSEINVLYNEWLSRYLDQGWLNKKNIIQHTKEMLNHIGDSLHATHPSNRNMSFDEPNNHLLVEDTISSYWQMIDYLKENDFELFLYALETGLEQPTFTVDETIEIGNKAKQLLLLVFEQYCIDEVEKASSFITYMVSRSGYSSIDVHISEVLDNLYPVLFEINSTVAKKALSKGLKFEHSHMILWKPRLNKTRVLH